MKKLSIILLCIISILTACSNSDYDIKQLPEETVVETPVIEEPEILEEEPEEPEEPEVLEEIIPENSKISVFTGLYIDETIADTRPIAVTINNLAKALPQSGLSQADIIYEVLAEGGITRFVGIFQDYTSEKIGPVRSARDYLNLFALDNDAIYIHHGGSPTGYSTLSSRNIDHIDGMYDTTAFFRDAERMSMSGMYEHSSYITSSGVLTSIANNKFETELDLEPMFAFDQETLEITDDVTNIVVPYSSEQVSEFKLVDGLYERYQTGEPQIDEETGEVLTFNNVLVQHANTTVIDSVGRRSIDLVGSGNGLLFKNGQSFEVTWEKDSTYSPTEWYINGEPITLTKGKTFICVVPLSLEVSVS